jgi:hypothetical protein
MSWRQPNKSAFGLILALFACTPPERQFTPRQPHRTALVCPSPFRRSATKGGYPLALPRRRDEHHQPPMGANGQSRGG